MSAVSGTVQKRALLSAVAMVPVASDDVRYHLCGVLLRVNEGGELTLCATNGHMLAERCIAKSGLPKGEWMLRSERLAAVKAVLKECKRFDEVQYSVDALGHLMIGAPVFGIAVIEKYDAEYPNYQQVIPKFHTGQTVSVAFNAEYVIALARALNHAHKSTLGHVRLEFDPSNPQGAISVVAINPDGPECTGVVMPVRDPSVKVVNDAFYQEFEARMEMVYSPSAKVVALNTATEVVS